MTHKEIVKALADLMPDALYALTGDNYEEIEWFDERPKPSMVKMEAAIANPLPERELTIDDKLRSVGLTISDLKVALGL